MCPTSFQGVQCWSVVALKRQSLRTARCIDGTKTVRTLSFLRSVASRKVRPSHTTHAFLSLYNKLALFEIL